MFNIGDKLDKANYTQGAIWCNENNAMIEVINGEYVIVAIPEPTIEEQNEAIRATREQLYIQTSDKLKADYDEAVARGAENAEELKIAWLESKDKIREENPYIVESVEDDVTVEEVQVEDKTLSVEPEIGADEAEAVEESEVIEDGL